MIETYSAMYYPHHMFFRRPWLLCSLGFISFFLLAPISSAQFSKLDDLGKDIAKKLKHAKQEKLAVADFAAPGGTASPQGSYFAALLTISIARHAKNIPVVQHDSFDVFLAKEKFSTSDLATPLALGALHTLLQLDYLVTGILSTEPNNYKITIVLRHLADGSQPFSATIKMDRTEFTDSLADPFPPKADYSIVRFSAKPSGPGMQHPPRCIHCPDPSYTDAARADKVQGTDTFEILISEAGQVVALHPLKMIGYGLDERAFETIRNWSFQPATDTRGNPVACIVPVEVTFRLR